MVYLLHGPTLLSYIGGAKLAIVLQTTWKKVRVPGRYIDTEFATHVFCTPSECQTCQI